MMYRLNIYRDGFRGNDYITTNRFILIHRACYKLLNTVISEGDREISHAELLSPDGRILLYWDRYHGLWYSSLLPVDLPGQDALVSQIESMGRSISGKIVVV